MFIALKRSNVNVQRLGSYKLVPQPSLWPSNVARSLRNDLFPFTRKLETAFQLTPERGRIEWQSLLSKLIELSLRIAKSVKKAQPVSHLRRMSTLSWAQVGTSRMISWCCRCRGFRKWPEACRPWAASARTRRGRVAPEPEDRGPWWPGKSYRALGQKRPVKSGPRPKKRALKKGQLSSEYLKFKLKLKIDDGLLSSSGKP